MAVTEQSAGMAAETPRLLYFADPMCSWCYGFAPNIQALAERLPVELVMGGLRAGETRQLSAGLRNEILQHWQHVQSASKRPFDFAQGLPLGFVYNTEPACRAVVAATQLNAELALPMLDAVHQAFYAQARDTTATDVLIELAGSVGLDKAAFADWFAQPQTIAATQAQFERARAYGVTGFPCIIVQYPERAKLVSIGYEALETVQEKLAALGLF